MKLASKREERGRRKEMKARREKRSRRKGKIFLNVVNEKKRRMVRRAEERGEGEDISQDPVKGGLFFLINCI